MNPLISQYMLDSASVMNAEIPKVDFHIHTNFTDGKASIEQVVEIAIKKGMKAICFTEHTEPWQHKHANWFNNYVNQIEEQRVLRHEEIHLFIGIEAPLLNFDGKIEATTEMISKVDFVLGAAHRYPTIEGRKVSDLSPTEAIDLEFRSLESLIYNTEVDCIAHIGATCSKYVTEFPKTLTEELIKLAAKENKIIEINPVYHQPLKDFLKLCTKHNVQVSLGSNAHGFGDIGMVSEKLIEILR